MNEDMVPRTSIQSLNGLLESLIVALARCRLSTLRCGDIPGQGVRSLDMCIQYRNMWVDVLNYFEVVMLGHAVVSLDQGGCCMETTTTWRMLLQGAVYLLARKDWQVEG